MRKRSVGILLACLVLITAANAIMLAETNLALNKAATASSIQGAGYEAAKAVDGNAGTRWSANFTGDPQWIYVDLGATYDINRVVLRWETAYGKAYQIQVSSNASSWTDVYATTTGDGGVDDINFTTTSARYVRMYGTQRGTSYSYSLWEFEVYGGSSDTQAPTVPTNLTATAVSSSQIDLSWTASTDNVGVTGYRIYRGGEAIATTAGTSYSDTGLSPNTTYSYTVSAYDAANNESGQSAPAGATTPATTYDDEFSSGTLDAKWSWVRQNAPNWSLTARAGYMRIVVEAGDLNHNPADNKNML
ncbi:MAG: discoidin domain-containing protein, partial [Bacteroidota bacterium]